MIPELFIGVDWSGARGEFHRGIQLAEAWAGDEAVRLITPPHPRGWSRQAVADYLMARSTEARVLAGIDFAFAHPIGEDGHYYEGEASSPTAAQPLWRMVDQTCADAPHLYGGAMWLHPQFGAYYNAPIKGGRGARFQSRRRQTEQVAASLNGRHPSPTFNCVGPAGVGTGSLAGMRLLHRMQGSAVIWPFAMPDASDRLVLVEIFPALYFTMAGVRDAAKKADPLAALNQGLAHFGAMGQGSVAGGLPDQDDIDALISAAALRSLTKARRSGSLWSLGDSLAGDDQHALAAQEGWIFGAGWAR